MGFSGYIPLNEHIFWDTQYVESRQNDEQFLFLCFIYL